MFFSFFFSLNFYIFFFFFFFNDTATTEIYTLSLHDALLISISRCCPRFTRYQVTAPTAQRKSTEITATRRRRPTLTLRGSPSTEAPAELLRSRPSQRDRTE